MRDYKVNSLIILHYGRDYLATALQAVYPLVDRQLIFFTPHPSHGHSTNIPPIESKQELQDSIPSWMNDKITWIDTDFWNEGQQRDYALSIASQDCDLVVTIDYDEIHHEHVLDRMLNHVWQMNASRRWLVNMLHFWRSFGYACTDNNWPVRIIDTRHSGGVGYVPKELGDIMHMGYAITDKVLRYKMQIHGHKDELRPNWYDEKWQAWPPPDDCHPTNGRNDEGIGWWNPQPFDKRELPYVLHSHPWFSVDRIE